VPTLTFDEYPGGVFVLMFEGSKNVFVEQLNTFS
jgi:hypothetical protein